MLGGSSAWRQTATVLAGLVGRVGLVVLVTPLPGCPKPVASDRSRATVPAKYSPFEVVIDGDLPYDVISFKDVGLGLDHAEQAFAYEAIAESLSLEIPAVLAVQARSRFVPGRAHPSRHQSCEARHVYVDLWRPGGHGWGYSLWSGCGEDANFALQELPKADGSQVDELARAIAASLAHATRTACFAKHC